jgi:hypothetical protein
MHSSSISFFVAKSSLPARARYATPLAERAWDQPQAPDTKYLVERLKLILFLTRPAAPRTYPVFPRKGYGVAERHFHEYVEELWLLQLDGIPEEVASDHGLSPFSAASKQSYHTTI